MINFFVSRDLSFLILTRYDYFQLSNSDLRGLHKHLKPESPYKRKGEESKFILSRTQAAFVFLLQKSKQHEQHMDLFVNMHMSRRGLMWAS